MSIFIIVRVAGIRERVELAEITELTELTELTEITEGPKRVALGWGWGMQGLMYVMAARRLPAGCGGTTRPSWWTVNAESIQAQASLAPGGSRNALDLGLMAVIAGRPQRPFLSPHTGHFLMDGNGGTGNGKFLGCDGKLCNKTRGKLP
jgi:hypothetical protein